MTPQHVTRLFKSTITRPEKFSFYRVNFKPISSRKFEQFTSRKLCISQAEKVAYFTIHFKVIYRSKLSKKVIKSKKIILKHAVPYNKERPFDIIML